ncbi:MULTISPECIES: hypothetical protein [Pseudomonas]|uniref:hypothetical protein n=1 Tax=Pseudomonas TaxID=286 RepID=UPI000C182A54|nr:hypothetical protein [Pseudomonas sp. 29]PIF52602.1 hypothetical protein CLU80_5080 [Pseudomonas sp. 29]
MSDSSANPPAPLFIKEAKGDEISMKDIPEGATAVTPKPSSEYLRDMIIITVGANSARFSLGPIDDRTYEFNIPREWMLDFAGNVEPLAFSYQFFANGTNPHPPSEEIKYRIVH